MSTQAHCVKGHSRDYSDCDYFNSMDAETVLAMLKDNGINVHTADDFNARCNWEIRCGDQIESEGDPHAFEKYIKKLERLDPKAIHEAFAEKEPKDQYTNGDIVEALKHWLANVDEKDHVIRIEWF